MSARGPLLALLLGALLLPACSRPWVPSEDDLPERIEPPPPELRTRTVEDPETGILLRRWSELVHYDGTILRQGLYEEWWPDGTRKAQRSYDQGYGVGRWRQWHEDGAPRSDYTHDLAGVPTTMSFWHENGRLAAEGPAAFGAKTGAWSHWRDDGSLESSGEYVEGFREGIWTFFHRDGSIAERGRYVRGRRTGDWERGPAGGTPQATREGPEPVPDASSSD